jgi:cohesin loading factor subunit SCC2
MEHRLADATISVREAVVDLVGRYMLSRPEFIDRYADQVIERLKDKVPRPWSVGEGVSV